MIQTVIRIINIAMDDHFTLLKTTLAARDNNTIFLDLSKDEMCTIDK